LNAWKVTRTSCHDWALVEIKETSQVLPIDRGSECVLTTMLYIQSTTFPLQEAVKDDDADLDLGSTIRFRVPAGAPFFIVIEGYQGAGTEDCGETDVTFQVETTL